MRKTVQVQGDTKEQLQKIKKAFGLKNEDQVISVLLNAFKKMDVAAVMEMVLANEEGKEHHKKSQELDSRPSLSNPTQKLKPNPHIVLHDIDWSLEHENENPPPVQAEEDES